MARGIMCWLKSWVGVVSASIAVMMTVLTVGYRVDQRYAKAGDLTEQRQIIEKGFQQTHAAILSLRRDRLRDEQSTLLQANRRRALSNEEVRRLHDIDVLIQRYDRAIEKLGGDLEP